MRFPKIAVQKKVMLDNRGHYRFYSANYNPEVTGKLKKHSRPKVPLIDMEAHQDIKTERDLLSFIHKIWGEGEYLLFGHCKGIRGLWVFWHGRIDSQGFVFYKRRIAEQADKDWKTEFQEAKDDGDTEYLKEIKDNIDEDKKELQEKSRKQRYGFIPFLKPSSRRGSFTMWNDPTPTIEEVQEDVDEVWNVEDNRKNNDENVWDVDLDKQKQQNSVEDDWGVDYQ